MPSYIIEVWTKVTNNIFKTIALVGAMGAAAAVMVEFYIVYNTAKEMPELIKKHRAIVEFERERTNILLHVLKAELDVNSIFPEVEHTNGGDAWYFTSEEINGKEYFIVYGATYKSKQDSYGYIDLNNNWHWIKDESVNQR